LCELDDCVGAISAEMTAHCQINSNSGVAAVQGTIDFTQEVCISVISRSDALVGLRGNTFLSISRSIGYSRPICYCTIRYCKLKFMVNRLLKSDV